MELNNNERFHNFTERIIFITTGKSNLKKRDYETGKSRPHNVIALN